MLHYLHIFYVPIVDAMYRYYGKYTLSNGILGFKKITLYGSFLWKRFIVKSESNNQQQLGNSEQMSYNKHVIMR